MLVNERTHQLKADLIVADHMRERAFNFWRRRNILLAWPIEPKGQTFLGNAVHKMAEALFPDWDPICLEHARLPVLDGSRLYIGDGFDAKFATDIIVNVGGADSDGDTILKNKSGYLSSNDFDAAVALYQRHVAPGHREAMTRTALAIKTLIDAASQDILELSVRSDFGELIPIPHHLWSTEQAYSRFAECQMDPVHPNISWQVNIVDIQMGVYVDNPLLPGNKWLFVDTENLQHLISATSPLVNLPKSQVDKGPKKAVSDREALAWWEGYTNRFPDPEHPTFGEAKAAWLDAFPQSSGNAFKNTLWDKHRPSWWPRRAR